MRRLLSLVMAKHIGQTITLELATSMAREVLAQEEGRLALPTRPTMAQIERLESLILQGEQVATPTKNYLAPGMYAREMFIPAGAVVTGAVHKTEHISIFVGDITLWTDGGMERLTGSHTFVSKPGAKRVGYAHADTWATGFFPTDKTDIAAIEDDLVEDANRLQSRLQELGYQPTPLLENK